MAQYFSLRLMALLMACVVSLGSQPLLAGDWDFDTRLGLIFSSERVYRGAPISDIPSFLGGPELAFKNGIIFRGPTILYSRDVNEVWSWNATLSYIKDDVRPAFGFVFGDGDETFRNQRAATWESKLGVKWQPSDMLFVETAINQDLGAHGGRYLSASVGSRAPYYVQLSVTGTVGDKLANGYAYGPDAVAGLGDVSIVASSYLPFLPGGGVMIPSYTWSRVAQPANRHADYVRGDADQTLLQLVMVWSI